VLSLFFQVRAAVDVIETCYNTRRFTKMEILGLLDIPVWVTGVVMFLLTVSL